MLKIRWAFCCKYFDGIHSVVLLQISNYLLPSNTTYLLTLKTLN